MIHTHTHTHTHIFSFIFFSIWFITEYWMQLPVLHSRTLFIHPMYNRLRPLTPAPKSIPPPPSLPLTTSSLLSMSVTLFVSCRLVCLCHISGSTNKWYHVVFVKWQNFWNGGQLPRCRELGALGWGSKRWCSRGHLVIRHALCPSRGAGCRHFHSRATCPHAKMSLRKAWEIQVRSVDLYQCQNQIVILY